MSAASASVEVELKTKKGQFNELAFLLFEFVDHPFLEMIN